MKFCTIIHTKKKPCDTLFYKPNGMDYIVTFYGTKGAQNINPLVNKVHGEFSFLQQKLQGIRLK